MPFPTTLILDTFSRADSSTTLGSNWTISNNSANWGNDPLGISSNAAYNPMFVNGGTAWWTASTFSGTLETYFTIKIIPSSRSLPVCLSLSNGGNTTGNGYTIYFYQPSDAVKLVKQTNTSSSVIATFTQAVNNGDTVGVSLSPSGLFTIYYKANGSTTWSLLGTYTDTTYSCNTIGITIIDSTTRITNFGGGQQVTNTGMFALIR